MTLILELPDKQEAALKAEAQGLSAEEYVSQVLAQDLRGKRAWGGFGSAYLGSHP